VLINDASAFQTGHFKEISDQAIRRQIENLFGPKNACVACAAAKFGVEGLEVGQVLAVRSGAVLHPYPIRTPIVEPAFLRTELGRLSV
jgi:hypothetical protein